MIQVLNYFINQGLSASKHIAARLNRPARTPGQHYKAPPCNGSSQEASRDFCSYSTSHYRSC